MTGRQRMAHAARVLLEQGQITPAAVVEATGCSRRQAVSDVQILREALGLVQVGAGRATAWALAPDRVTLAQRVADAERCLTSEEDGVSTHTKGGALTLTDDGAGLLVEALERAWWDPEAG